MNLQHRAFTCVCCAILLPLLASFAYHAVQAQTTFPQAAEACFEAGENFLIHDQLDESIALFTECLRLNPYFADAYYSRGLAHERRKVWNDALIDYSIYLDLKPDHVEALLNRAQVRYRLALYALAKEDFSRLLHLPKGETTTLFFRQSVFASGVDQLFTTQGSNKVYLYNWLGLIETQLRNFTAGIIHFDSAIGLNPSDADLYINRGIAHQRNNDREKAKQDFEKALSLDPHQAIAKHNLFVLSGEEKQGNQNFALLDSAIADNPKLPYAFAERGYEEMLAGNYAAALEDYNYAIALDKNEPDYFLNRGAVYEKLKNWTAAYQDYSAALGLTEGYEKAWLNRGNLLFLLGKFREALEDYSSALLYAPTYAAAYYNRGLVYQKLTMLKKACADLQQAKTLGMRVSDALLQQVCK